MAEEEIRKFCIRLAFQYESAIDILLTKGLIDAYFAAIAKGKFYDSLVK